MSRKISVAIPIRIVHEEQYWALLKCLNSVFTQTVKPFQVIISVDGTKEIIEHGLREQFPKDEFQVVKNHGEPGISRNSNNALNYASGDLIHVMHGDDAIISENCYERVLQAFEDEKCKWLILGGETLSGMRIVPLFDQHTKFGVNRLGGPSGLITAREDYEKYDPRFSMMTDVVNFEIYFRKFGQPTIIPESWIMYGDLQSQASRNIPKNTVIAELKLLYLEFKTTGNEIAQVILDKHVNPFHRQLIFDALGELVPRKIRLTFRVKYLPTRLKHKIKLFSGTWTTKKRIATRNEK